MHPIFIPWCAGATRHERLVRKHVPDSDPGSIPAPAGDTNYRLPNNDSRGSQEKCSAGACPQLGAACVAQATPDPSINQCIQFSHLGVPAPAGMGDWYENSSFSSRQRTVAKPVARGLVQRLVPTTPSTIPCGRRGWGSHPGRPRRHQSPFPPILIPWRAGGSSLE